MLHLEYPLSTPTLRLTPFQRGDNYADTGGVWQSITSLPARLSDGAQRTKVQAKDIGGGGDHFAKIPVPRCQIPSERVAKVRQAINLTQKIKF
jgi:hypothetical protein